MCTKFVVAGSVLGVGVVIVALGAGLGWGVFPGLVEKATQEGVALVNGSDAWNMWVDLPIPLEFRVYLYEVTNPAEVTAGARPNLTERGPYVYSEYKSKNVMKIHDDKPWVTYRQDLHFEFNQTLSGNLSDTDVVTMLNPSLMGAILEGDASGGLGIINGAIEKAFHLHEKHTGVFITTQVKNILFDGIRIYCSNTDGLFELNRRLFCGNEGLAGSDPTTSTIRRDPRKPNDFLYSFFTAKEEDETDGVYTVNTGVENARDLGWIHRWGRTDEEVGSETLPMWGGPECNVIRGTDAAIFPPFITRDKRIDIFSSDLCRSLYAEYDSDISYKGVAGYHFVAANAQLGTVEEKPDNYCFCGEKAGCLHHGAFDLSSCVNGSVVLTWPHFFDAPEYLAMVDGVSPPVASEHQTFLDLEPNTGVPLRGGKRVQFNMMLKPISKVNIAANLPEALLPMIWIHEGVELDDTNMDLLKSELGKLAIVEGVKWGLIGVGLGTTLVGASLFFAFWLRG